MGEIDGEFDGLVSQLAELGRAMGLDDWDILHALENQLVESRGHIRISYPSFYPALLVF